MPAAPGWANPDSGGWPGTGARGSAHAPRALSTAHGAFGLLVASTGTSQGPFGFARTSGYHEDADSGLKLLGHRYYDASTGRFLTRDPIKDGQNWYAYCNANPLKFVDPDGQIVFIIGIYYLGAGLIAGGTAAYLWYIAAAKSEEEYLKHLNGNRKNKEEIDELSRELDKAAGKKRREIQEAIEEALKRLRGHQKEMGQKWPGKPTL